jgi:hypothetical protein
MFTFGEQFTALSSGQGRPGTNQAVRFLLRVAVISTMLSTRWNWQKLFSYGEVICFVSAWAIGILVAMQEQRPDPTRAAIVRFSAASDTLGIQATLRH